MEKTDNIIAETRLGSSIVHLHKAQGREENFNFLVVCTYGDYSGFMSLRDALKRLDELSKENPSRYYAVVER